MPEPSMVDPIAEHYEVSRGGVRRDRYGRAMLTLAGSSVRVPYTSASSLADYISSPYALHRWRTRYLARGMGIREDLAALASAESYSTGFGDEDAGENKASGLRLDTIIDRALDAARVYERADYGTAVHHLTEPDADPLGRVVPGRMKADVEAFKRAVRGMEIVATEVFVANDELMAAGTFDHLVVGTEALSEMIGQDVAGTLLTTDKKTGRIEAAKASVQLDVYAGGEIYDVETDERTTFEAKYGMPINRKVGIFFHIPAGQGKAIPYPLDLEAGHQAALHAVWVRDWQRRSLALGKPINTDRLALEELWFAIRSTNDQASLEGLWREYQDLWTDDHTAAANEQLGL